MDTSKTRGYIMVINSKGERKRVKISDYNKANKLNEAHTNNDFKYDLEWDLSHGFTEAKKAFSDIENGNYK